MPGKVKEKTGSTGGVTRWIRRRPKRERRRLKFFKKSDSCSVTGGLFFGESQKDRPERSVGRKIQKRSEGCTERSANAEIGNLTLYNGEFDPGSG